LEGTVPDNSPPVAGGRTLVDLARKPLYIDRRCDDSDDVWRATELSAMDPARSQIKGVYAEWGALKIAKAISDWLFFYPISKNSFGLFPDAGGAFYFPEAEETPVESGMSTDNVPLA
jgi:hypothetical protein